MAKKSVGYVELEWTCPNCGTRNPGSNTVCASCGAPQPEDVLFEQPAQETLLTDERKIARAKAAPDIHCPFCGTRNPAGSTVCRQCGGDLTEGARREAGQIVGAHRSAPAPQVTCPACGTLNPATATRCQQCATPLGKAEPAAARAPAGAGRQTARRGSTIWIAVIAAVLLVACIAIFLFTSRTTETIGVVESVNWQRSVALEQLVPVTRETWLDNVPAESPVGACERRVRRTQNSPAPNSQEVCGTPYTVDEGTGFGAVVQDCVYEVYESWCEYTVDEWRQIDVFQVGGSGFQPTWPELDLLSAQRLGSREERYQCVFNVDGSRYAYTTSNLDTYAQCDLGSEWILRVNAFDDVREIEPRN